MGDEVVLLDAEFSMFGMRARIALAEKEIKYEYREQDLEHKGQLLLEMNPVHKKVPVLIHNGRPICESLVVLQYIDDAWKDKSPLMPSDPYERARASFWADVVDKKVSYPSKKIWTTKGEEVEVASKELVEGLRLMEEELGDKIYFGGDIFGFVDVALITFYCWFETYETLGNFSIEKHCPKLMAWARRCMERESVGKSLADPKKVYEFVMHAKNKYGF